MKKKIGNAMALYPTPLVVIGAMTGGKPNWTLVGHLGIIGHDRVLVSMVAAHKSNEGIRETGACPSTWWMRRSSPGRTMRAA